MQRYAITDRSIFSGSEQQRLDALRVQVAAWVAAGVEWIQLREKDLPAEELCSLARELAASLPGRDIPTGGSGSPRTRLVVNGMQPESACALGASGVHLRGEATAEQIRHARSAGGVVSVSCHTLQEVEIACSARADAVLWAPVFGKTFQGALVRIGAGLDPLRQACETAFPVPVFALGGITLANARPCVQSGAAGVAGIRLFHGSEWQQLATLDR